MSMEGIVKKIRENRVPEILVKDMMTKKVYVLNDNDNLDVAKLLMDSIHIRHIPIINKNDEFVGLLTHRDLLKLSVSSLADMDEEDQQKNSPEHFLKGCDEYRCSNYQSGGKTEECYRANHKQ